MVESVCAIFEEICGAVGISIGNVYFWVKLLMYSCCMLQSNLHRIIGVLLASSLHLGQ